MQGQYTIWPHFSCQSIHFYGSCHGQAGSQSCLVGISMVCKLGVHRHNLIPIKMEMYEANDHNIDILGAAILRFSGQDRAGNTIETHQLNCATDALNRLFLSKDTCPVLRMITDKFPTIGEISPDIHIKDSKVTTQCYTMSDINPQPVSGCDRHKHTSPPPRCTKPPVLATKENRE